jgi:hypothetical protein
MKIRLTLVASLISISVVIFAQGQTSESSPARTRLVIRSDQFASVQQLLDEQSARGYVVSGVSFHSSIKNLHSNGRLRIDLEMPATPGKRQYRALTTDLESAALQKALNDPGVSGFRLLVQTPIPLELGLVRPRDMFLAVMEKTAATSDHHEYRVIAYRHLPWVRQQIKQATADGFAEVCKHQFGPVVFLVMEK